MLKFLCILSVLLLTTGCDQYKTQNQKAEELQRNQEIATLKQEIIELKTELGEFQKEIGVILSDLLLHKAYINEKIEGRLYETVVFTPSDKGYLPINSTVGTLLISLADIKKYANGYKIILNIGNPTLATFNNINLTASYGKAYQEKEDVIKWEKNLKKIKIPINKPVLPGVWNKFSIVLSPAKEEDLEHIEIHFEGSSIFLMEDRRKSEG